VLGQPGLRPPAATAASAERRRFRGSAWGSCAAAVGLACVRRCAGV